MILSNAGRAPEPWCGVENGIHTVASANHLKIQREGRTPTEVWGALAEGSGLLAQGAVPSEEAEAVEEQDLLILQCYAVGPNPNG